MELRTYFKTLHLRSKDSQTEKKEQIERDNKEIKANNESLEFQQDLAILQSLTSANQRLSALL